MPRQNISMVVTDIINNMRKFEITLVLLALSWTFSGCAIGGMAGDALYESVTGDYHRYDRDSGIIGEKKTLKPLKIYHDKATGSTLRSVAKGNFATPQVAGSVAKFDSGAAHFEFNCLGWKYRTQNYWSTSDSIAGRITRSVELESPDRKILIRVSLVELPVSSALNMHAMTLEQERILQKWGLAEAPLAGKESLIAAEQAVQWYISHDEDGLVVLEKDKSAHFETETINGKDFVKTELNISNKKTNAERKSLLWAHNYRSFWWHDGKRYISSWICQIITEPSDFSITIAVARQIPETAEFKKYSLNNEPDKMVPGIRYLNYRGEVVQ